MFCKTILFIYLVGHPKLPVPKNLFGGDVGDGLTTLLGKKGVLLLQATALATRDDAANLRDQG